jgi:hypothetical protein
MSNFNKSKSIAKTTSTNEHTMGWIGHDRAAPRRVLVADVGARDRIEARRRLAGARSLMMQPHGDTDQQQYNAAECSGANQCIG